MTVQSSASGRHSSVQQVCRWFGYDHLPRGTARAVSGACAVLAEEILDTLSDDDPELTAGLRKLVEAKDCFVRAALAEEGLA